MLDSMSISKRPALTLIALLALFQVVCTSVLPWSTSTAASPAQPTVVQIATATGAVHDVPVGGGTTQ